jgi:hypothetical protein
MHGLTRFAIVGLVLGLLASWAGGQETQEMKALRAEADMYKATAERQRAQMAQLQKDMETVKAELAKMTDENARLRAALDKLLPPEAKKTVAPGEATYAVVPVKGEIGVDFTVEQLRMGLKNASDKKATVVVLEIDTPGGSIEEAEKTVGLLMEQKNVRIVALVRRALSAGAPITLTCKEIYMTSGAMIGAAVPFRQGANQLPQEIEEKYKSVWRACCRKAADYGGHPSVLAEAMVDPGFPLYLRDEDGTTVVDRTGRGRMLKSPGRILTLTAREAVECKLAAGIAEDMAGLGLAMNMPAWKPIVETKPTTTGVATAPKSDVITTGTIYRKAMSLGLERPEQTDLQQKEALRNWNDWLAEAKVVGSEVEWRMKVVEVTEYDATRVQASLTQARNRQTQAEQELATSKRTPRPDKIQIKQLEQTIRNAKEEVSKLSRAARNAKEYPYVTMSTALESPRVLITALVSKNAKDYLAKTSAGQILTLKGKITEVKLLVLTDDSLGVGVMLEQCDQPGK